MNDVPIAERACATCKWQFNQYGIFKCGRVHSSCLLERKLSGAGMYCGPEGKYWTPRTYSTKKDSFWSWLFG